MSEKIPNIGYKHQERVLMLHGYTVRKDYPDLYNIVEKYEMVNDHIYASIGQLDPYTETLLQRENGILTNIIDILQNEWDTISVDGSDCEDDPLKTHICQLCGQKGLRYIFKIKNTLTHFELEVGSECIKNYEIRVFGLTGKAKEEALNARKSRAHMSKQMLDMDVKTDGGLVRLKLAGIIWNNIIFLPPKELTKEILEYQKRLNDLKQRVQRSKATISSADADAFKKHLKRLVYALDLAKKTISAPSSQWRVSQAIYKWSKVEDRKPENKNEHRSSLTVALEEAAEINSTNVHRILEDGHVTKCIALLQTSSLCNHFRIEDGKNDSGAIRIHFLIDKKTYAYWIQYSRLIFEAAKLGFPDRVSPVDQIPIREVLLSLKKPFDINNPELQDAWSLVNEICREVGITIENINDDGDRLLIRTQNNRGTIVESSKLINPVSMFALNSNRKLCIESIKSTMANTDYDSIKNVRSEWRRTYERKH